MSGDWTKEEPNAASEVMKQSGHMRSGGFCRIREKNRQAHDPLHTEGKNAPVKKEIFRMLEENAKRRIIRMEVRQRQRKQQSFQKVVDICLPMRYAVHKVDNCLLKGEGIRWIRCDYPTVSGY